MGRQIRADPPGGLANRRAGLRTSGEIAVTTNAPAGTRGTWGSNLTWSMADLDVRYEWRTLGKLSVLDGRLTFPEVGHIPGVYSFTFSGSRGLAEYIGEAADLARRWYSYARPGPTQRTNLRLSPYCLRQ
jgi:hypothetical protein